MSQPRFTPPTTDHPRETFRFVCFVTITALVLFEQFQTLPSALVALAAGWYVVNLDAR